ncbi:octopine/nopaline transport system substrate-binding protein [Candidatus Pantoea symbiotica]|jgi:octopine/nopaline transport system substrate-binding protein|uniref:Octopine/nopaline transport system substrate-binding protein n=2 Tax=Pantoea TaxID=53335 RepID=A0A1I4CWZ8_9GAMM|nr:MULTISPECIES: transporter substrate-binding domain-containing protein [Pantoea]MRS18306.1 transporter substrate-binding domain-containing protein [Enterobacteriaceae bacterium RIT692]MRT25439.1 transporter substrate-binding domain-containing protein [Enterobacteriaceae bacterium RIT697]MRT42742.1 transporter substrate-binding domain-containing protein [Enterobacteriaceae bacterium RIT702]UVC31771.1 transporter substrate-binding domain-containing protein [Pantoea sp. SOD02]KAJ9430694.1 trans
MMRKGLFTASVGMLLLASSALVQAKDFGTLKFATEAAYPPFNQSTPNGKIVGYEPDMVAEIAKRAGFKYEIVAQKWSGMIPGLVDGKYDAVIDAVTVTPKREEVVDFSRQYTVSVSGFVTLKGSAVDTLPGNGEVVLADDEAGMTKSIDALKAKFKGKTIAVQVATIQADFLNKYLADVATIRTYQAGPETFADLLNGRVDAVMASRTNLNAYVKKHADTVNSTGYGFSGGVLGQGSAIAIQKNNPELKAALDNALNSMIKDGTLKQLSEKWFGENVAPKE